MSFEVRFLEKLQRLLAEGDFTSTYKLAVLLGLTELSSRLSPEARATSPAFTTRQLAEEIIRIYWPQVRAFPAGSAARDHVLLQNAGKQAAIVSRISSFQTSSLGRSMPSTHLDGLLTTRRSRYESLLSFVEWKLIEMPLPRLQNLPAGPDDFLYEIPWTVADVEPRGGRLKRLVQQYQREGKPGFDNRIIMRPGVAETLARLRGIVRDLVESRWILKIRQLDPSVREEPSLYEHLFGLTRTDLSPVRDDLVRFQSGTCFYCGRAVRRVEIDHFIPWSLSRNDRIENLVVACHRCNSRKRQFLAATDSLGRWVERFSPAAPLWQQLQEISRNARWPSDPPASLSLARLIYSQHPPEAKLWNVENEFLPWSKPSVIATLDTAYKEMKASNQG